MNGIGNAAQSYVQLKYYKLIIRSLSNDRLRSLNFLLSLSAIGRRTQDSVFSCLIMVLHCIKILLLFVPSLFSCNCNDIFYVLFISAPCTYVDIVLNGVCLLINCSNKQNFTVYKR